MRIAKIRANDIANGEGIRVTLFVQGCARHCPECFNPETWDFNGGTEIDINNLISELSQLINKNNVQRGFSILGGEPLNPENRTNVAFVIKALKQTYPDLNIWVWTGYTIEELQKMNDKNINYILNTINTLVDGPFIKEERDLTLPHAGSRNQRVIKLTKIKK